MSSYQYKESHCGDKTILWPSYLHNGISYTGKTTFLYWIRRLLSGANLTTIALKPLIVILYSFQLKFGKSHNTPVSYPTMHHFQQKCAHVCTFLLQNGALWNICLIVVVVILFPNRIQQYNTMCTTNITNSRVIIYIVMWFCWWPPEKPWAYQAGSHNTLWDLWDGSSRPHL